LTDEKRGEADFKGLLFGRSYLLPLKGEVDRIEEVVGSKLSELSSKENKSSQSGFEKDKKG
jgi:hypothetical protein